MCFFLWWHFIFKCLFQHVWDRSFKYVKLRHSVTQSYNLIDNIAPIRDRKQPCDWQRRMPKLIGLPMWSIGEKKDPVTSFMLSSCYSWIHVFFVDKLYYYFLSLIQLKITNICKKRSLKGLNLGLNMCHREKIINQYLCYVRDQDIKDTRLICNYMLYVSTHIVA